MKLSDKTLPAGKSEALFFDDKLSGFGIRLRKGGKRTWIVQYRVGAQQRRKTLGSADAVTEGQAREAARRDLAAVQLGGDPQARKVKERARAAVTLESVATQYLRHQEACLRPRSYEQVALHLKGEKAHWAPHKSLPIHQIARRDVAARLGEIAAARGPVAANRARTTLSGLFSWAMKEGLADENPVAGTNRQANEQARERVLSDAELVAIWKACRDDDYGRIVRLLILTGQRRDEVSGMTRSEIGDLAGRKWSLPSERTKNGRAHDVPLSDLANEILESALSHPGRQKREVVFGDGARATGGTDRGFSGWSKAKAQMDQRIAVAEAKVAAWTLHDLRRTAATRMADLGVLPHVVEAVLNHVSGSKGGVAGIYNRAAYAAEKRQALDLWAAHIEALLEGRPASNVIPLRG